MAQLRTLRAERKAIRQQAFEEAQLLAQLAYSKGEKYDPARDFPPEILAIGSDFSSAGIRRLIGRNQRLNEARRLVGQPIPASIALKPIALKPTPATAASQAAAS